MTDDPERRREFTRWRISAEWAVPLDLVTGDTVEEMRAAAAALRPEFLPPTAA